MKQLSGLDTSFLNLETATSFGHVSSLSIYGRPDDPDFDPYQVFRSQIESKLPILEPFRRRLVEVPFGLDRPYWINDPDFDLDFHLRHIAVPGKGTDEQVGELVGRLVGRPMDRSRPLWEVYVIEGLESGDFGILTKVHHATIDGAAGAEMLVMILEPGDPDAVDTWRPESVPGPGQLMARTAVEVARTPAKALRLQIKSLQAIGELTRTRGFGDVANALRKGLPGPVGTLARRLLGSEISGDDDRPPLVPAFGGPRTPFNASITAHRRFAYRTARLDDIKAIREATGATINDVVMTVCAGALRRYLLDHDALPEENLIAMVPVSIRTGNETDKWSNRVSAIFAEIPTSTEGSGARLTEMHESMVVGKGQFDLMPADMLLEMSELAPPALAVRAARIAARTKISDRTNPPANLVISNVPGPRQPLFLAEGAPLKHYYPVSTIVDGQGLNVTVQSYVDKLDFGLVACRELVPDLWKLVGYCVEEIDLLARDLGVKLPPKTRSSTHAKSKTKVNSA
nr:putative wax ester synthase/acyl-CoA:diacylglycerol acyltransferase [uncultured bacterium]